MPSIINDRLMKEDIEHLLDVFLRQELGPLGGVAVPAPNRDERQHTTIGLEMRDVSNKYVEFYTDVLDEVLLTEVEFITEVFAQFGCTCSLTPKDQEYVAEVLTGIRPHISQPMVVRLAVSNNQDISLETVNHYLRDEPYTLDEFKQLLGEPLMSHMKETIDTLMEIQDEYLGYVEWFEEQEK
jgi:hypothetical protein